MSLNETCPLLVKEHRFACVIGRKRHVFVVEELVAGEAAWPAKFRLKLYISARSEMKKFFGASCYGVAKRAADYLARSAEHAGAYTKAPSPLLPPRQILQTVQVQEIESEDSAYESDLAS